jgi:hypothetical protein
MTAQTSGNYRSIQVEILPFQTARTGLVYILCHVFQCRNDLVCE